MGHVFCPQKLYDKETPLKLHASENEQLCSRKHGNMPVTHADSEVHLSLSQLCK